MAQNNFINKVGDSAEVYFCYIQRIVWQVNGVFIYVGVLGAILGRNLVIIFNYKVGLVSYMPVFLNIEVIFATENAYVQTR